MEPLLLLLRLLLLHELPVVHGRAALSVARFHRSVEVLRMHPLGLEGRLASLLLLMLLHQLERAHVRHTLAPLKASLAAACVASVRAHAGAPVGRHHRV